MLIKSLSLKRKFVLLLGVVFVGFVILSSLTVFQFKNGMLREKKLKLKNVTETAHGIIEYYYKLSLEGKLSEQDAKNSAIALIKSIRYEGAEYFWINDDTIPIPKMVMHPTVPELDGKLLDAEKFNCARTIQYGMDGEIFNIKGGKNLFQAFNEVVSKSGIGYVTYNWPKPLGNGKVTKELYPKLSFVKKFDPWGWVIGSGIYIDDVNSEFMSKALWNISVSLILIAFIAVAFWFMSSSILKPIDLIISQTKRISDGDLTRSVDYSGNDEIGSLAKNVNSMTTKLKEMIGDISVASQNIVTSSNHFKIIAEKLAKGANSQTEQSQRIATAAEEMSQTITDIAKNADVAAETSEEAMKTAYNGKEIADGAVNTINSVYTSTVELAQMVQKLNNRASEIGNIVTVIKDIADQTNLLALNAAIEAARAGEQGRGFAVVADEVRKLADRTIKATGEISEKIGVIQQESIETNHTMTSASEKVTKATKYIKEVECSLNQIVDAVQRVKDQITHIATAVDEQSSASEDVVQNIEETATISKEIDKIALEIISGTNKLTDIVNRLEKNVSVFQV